VFLALTLVGLALTIVGTVLAGTALVSDWRKYRRGQPIVPRLPPLRGGQQMTRHPVDTAAATDSASYEMRRGPALDAPLEEQVAWFREGLERLRSDMGQEIAQQVSTLRAEHRQATEGMQGTAGQLRGELVDLATGSVRQELFGLFLVGLGSLFSTGASLLGTG
jgi:hypothetical protein